MGLLDRLNQKLGASGKPAEDAGTSAREEAQRAMAKKRAEQERTAGMAQDEVVQEVQKSTTANAQAARQGALTASRNSQTAGQSSQVAGQVERTTTAEAAAILAGKEPSRVAGGIFFFDGDRMMVISEGGRFIQKQRAIQYDQLESYELVQDGEILAQNSVSAIGNMRPDHDAAESENSETADTIITGVKAADTKIAGVKAADTKIAGVKAADTKKMDMKAADTKTSSMKKHCVSLSVIMYFKATLESSSGESPERIEIPFITTKTKIGGFLYRTNRAPADQLIEALDLVIASCR